MKLEASPVALEDWLRPTIESIGYILWGIEFSNQNGKRLIRIFIDSNKGININDCALTSEQVSALIDANQVYTDDYVLEVSSPGLDRTFFAADQLTNYLGRTVQVRSKQLTEGRRSFVAIIKEVVGNQLKLKTEHEIIEMNFSQTERIKLKAP